MPLSYKLCRCIFLLSVILFYTAMGFIIPSPKLSATNPLKPRQLTMKWAFSSGMGGMQESGLVGADGEFYFHPQKTAKIIGPKDTIGKKLFIPLLTYNNIILPGSSESLTVFEMRNRQLLNDVEQNGGVFGVIYHAQSIQRVSLVGSLVRIKSRKFTEDGRISCVIEGLDRFYLEEVVSERPYIKGLVRVFKDFTESPAVLDQLELQVFAEAQTNLKMMELLLPQRNISLSSAALENRPWVPTSGIRAIHFGSDEHDLVRRNKFSYAIIDMLQISPLLKLSLMQEHVIEKRYAKCLSILEKGGQYLREELKNKGLISSDEQLMEIKSQIATSQGAPVQSNWVPENYQDGSWVQMATMM